MSFPEGHFENESNTFTGGTRGDVFGKVDTSYRDFTISFDFFIV